MAQSASTLEVVQPIRAAYVRNVVLGLCRWFDTFDENADQRNLDVCAALLTEIREQGYACSPDELAYVDSREGVLELCRGLQRAHDGDLGAARERCRRSLEIQQRVGASAAVGQVNEILAALDQRLSGGGSGPDLDSLTRKFPVLGGSDILVRERLIAADGRQGHEVIRAAMEAGLVEPLLHAISTSANQPRPVPEVRGLAAAALGRFPETEEWLPSLLSALDDEHWPVRWRAAEELIRQPFAAGADPQRLADCFSRETEPEVRRALATWLMQHADRSVTPVLAEGLADPDPLVRWVVAEVLSLLGDRRALDPLRRTADGKDVYGRSVAAVVQEAITEIQTRHPPSNLEEFLAVRISDVGERYVSSAGHFSYSPIGFRIAIRNPSPDLVLRLWCRNPIGEMVVQQDRLLTDVLAATGRTTGPQPGSLAPGGADFHEPEAPSPWLVRGQDGATSWIPGMRVQCVRDHANRSPELRVGDVGTVHAVAPDGEIGVAWDRPVSGHDGNVHFHCDEGHGWYVRAEEIVALSLGHPQVTVVHLEIAPPSPAGWPVGPYTASLRLTEGDGGEVTEEDARTILFHVLPPADLTELAVCLAVDREHRPLRKTPLIFSDTPSVYFVVGISQSPSALPVTAKVYDPVGTLIEEHMKCTATHVAHYLSFVSHARRYSPGTHRVEFLLGATTGAKSLEFSVVECPRILRATMCCGIDELQRAKGPHPVELFAGDTEAIFCSVELAPVPPLTKVLAHWYYRGDAPTLILSSAATVQVAGPQAVAFSLGRPQAPWPGGEYAIRLCALTPYETQPIPECGKGIETASSLSEERWCERRFRVAESPSNPGPASGP